MAESHSKHKQTKHLKLDKRVRNSKLARKKRTFMFSSSALSEAYIQVTSLYF